MKPTDIDRVFGRSRLRMVTGDHVEVFREPALPGERRRYTKRFLATEAGDFRHWTEREWRILARLVGHGISAVPEVVRFDRGAAEQPALVQTYDAGITVDHWATLLPVQRDGRALRHVFEDCAHWWALARHCLIALDAIHELQLVHLDLKADNVCIPCTPADFDPRTPGQAFAPDFGQIALIDFAFSLVSGAPLTRALPIARQTEYDYQSPRLLEALEAGSRGDLVPTRRLDWRCDVFSLAAMLRRYLPDTDAADVPQRIAGGWTPARQAQARTLLRRLLQAHDSVLPARRPHAELIALATAALTDAALAASLARRWTLAIEQPALALESPTPVTRVAMPVSIDPDIEAPALVRQAQARQGRQRAQRWAAVAALVSVAAVGAPWLYRSVSAPDELSGLRLPDTLPAAPAEAPVMLAQAPAAPTPPAPVAPAVPDEVAELAPAPKPAPSPALVSAPPPATPVEAPPPPKPAVIASPAAAAPRVAAPRAEPARRAAGTAPVRSAKASARPAKKTEPTAKASAPPPSKAAPAQSERERLLARLTQRGPLPKTASAAGTAAWPAGAVAAVSTPAPAVSMPALTASREAPGAPAPVVANTPVQPPALTPHTAPSTVTAAAATTSAAPPQRVVEPARSTPRAQDLSVRADELLARELPRLAQRAERRVQRVLQIAAQAPVGASDEAIRRAAAALPEASPPAIASVGLAAENAQVLHDSAQHAYWRRGRTREAHELQTQAFAANPLDAEVAGSLAFLSLKLGPDRAETARQLALHALTLPDSGGAASRVELWTTLAIASALAGRDSDSRDAWFVSLAIAAQPERQCRAAVNAYSAHGEPLRAPVEAMLYRAHAAGLGQGAALCEWPAHWMGRSPWALRR